MLFSPWLLKSPDTVAIARDSSLALLAMYRFVGCLCYHVKVNPKPLKVSSSPDETPTVFASVSGQKRPEPAIE